MAAPMQPRGGPSIVATPKQGATGPSVTATPPTPSSGPPVTATPGKATSGPPVTAQPVNPRQPEQPKGMPDDIRRYLAFLQRVETERKGYEARLSNVLLQLIPGLMMPNFDDEHVQALDPRLVAMYNRTAQEYAVAGRRFQVAAGRIGVPPSCRVLHANYSYALSRNPVIIMETAKRLVAGDYGGLHQMLSTVGADINTKFDTADDELARICDQYNMHKPFSIGNGRAGGSLFGF
jgi:hypothetical protein